MMTRQMKFWVLAAILLCGTASLTSCHSNDGREQQVAEIADENRQGDCMTVIEDYLTDSIAPHYAPGEMCIPCIQVVEYDETNPDSVLVWGGFWVNNYNVVGDTLKCVSGGSHPGMMTLQPSEAGGYAVTAFEQVKDGSSFLPSAKRIFGNRFDAFQKINSDDKKREEVRAAQIADYVKSHNLPVKYYQDYGWPAKQIAVNSEQ